MQGGVGNNIPIAVMIGSLRHTMGQKKRVELHKESTLLESDIITNDGLLISRGKSVRTYIEEVEKKGKSELGEGETVTTVAAG